MSLTIAEYDFARYNALPDIRTVVKALTKSGANALVKGALKDAIVRHSVVSRFAIAALHAPFRLEGDDNEEHVETALEHGEQLVTFGTATLPVNTSSLAPEQQALIVPALWSFRDGVAPLAFAHSTDPTADALSASDLAFFADVQEIIAKNPGAEHLGIALLARAPTGVTTLRGRNAVTLPATVASLSPGDERYDVLWAVEGQEVVVRGAVSGGSPAGHFHPQPRECYGYGGQAIAVCYSYGGLEDM